MQLLPALSCLPITAKRNPGAASWHSDGAFGSCSNSHGLMSWTGSLAMKHPLGTRMLWNYSKLKHNTMHERICMLTESKCHFICIKLKTYTIFLQMFFSFTLFEPFKGKVHPEMKNPPSKFTYSLIEHK